MITEGCEHHVRMRAYLIWEREGRPDGREEAHWLAAEREIASEVMTVEIAPVEIASNGAATVLTVTVTEPSTVTATEPSAMVTEPANGKTSGSVLGSKARIEKAVMEAKAMAEGLESTESKPKPRKRKAKKE